MGRTEWYLQEHAQGRRTPARPSPNAPPATGHACACSRSTTPPLSVRLRSGGHAACGVSVSSICCGRLLGNGRSGAPHRLRRARGSRHRTWVCHAALGRGGPDCKAYVTTSISSSFVVLPTWPSGRVFDYVSRAPGPPLALCRTEHCVIECFASACDAAPRCRRIRRSSRRCRPGHLLPIRVPGHDCWHHIRRLDGASRRRAAKIHSLRHRPPRAASPPASSWLPSNTRTRGKVMKENHRGSELFVKGRRGQGRQLRERRGPVYVLSMNVSTRRVSAHRLASEFGRASRRRSGRLSLSSAGNRTVAAAAPAPLEADGGSQAARPRDPGARPKAAAAPAARCPLGAVPSSNPASGDRRSLGREEHHRALELGRRSAFPEAGELPHAKSSDASSSPARISSMSRCCCTAKRRSVNAAAPRELFEVRLLVAHGGDITRVHGREDPAPVTDSLYSRRPRR